jgi:hypothetical protein
MSLIPKYITFRTDWSKNGLWWITDKDEFKIHHIFTINFVKDHVDPSIKILSFIFLKLRFRIAWY